MDGMHIAAAGIRAAQTNLDIASNNLANVNTTAFQPGRTTNVTGPGGRGVEAIPGQTNQPGPVAFTGQPLDLALTDNSSYFAVRHGEGRLAFTRDGAFTVDGQGRIVTQRGDIVQPGITVPPTATGIAVDQGGAVTAAMPDGTTQNLGTIETVRFPNPGGLQAIGENLAVPTPASGAAMPGAGGEVLSGALTMSATDVATEMVNLIIDERTTGFNAASVRTQDEMMGTILDLKR